MLAVYLAGLFGKRSPQEEKTAFPVSSCFETAVHVLDRLPNFTRYPEPSRNFAGSHLLTDTLRCSGGVEQYQLWQDASSNSVTALVRLGSRLCGHPTLVQL